MAQLRPSSTDGQIRSLSDIQALETAGIDALCPLGSPQKILENCARTWPDRIAIHYLPDATEPQADQRWSFGDLYDDVQAAASVFREAGVQADHSVALLTSHTPAAQIALWGAQVAGRACPINPLLRPEHIASLFDAADVRAAVVMGTNDEQDYWQSLVPALRDSGVTVPVFDCDSQRESPGSSGSFEALVNDARQRGSFVENTGSDDATAALYHTGGTTGAPKLVRHTRRNEAHVARSCAVIHGYQPGDVVVNGFPLFHVAGAFVYGLSVLSSGATLLVPGRLGMRNASFISNFWEHAKRCGVTVIGSVPTLLAGLLAIPVNVDVSNIRVALTGGSPLPPELADDFEAKTGIPVRNIFGMTESAGAIALEPVAAARTPLCCGFPLPFSEVAIVSQSAEKTDVTSRVATGQTGIVAVRGPNISPGYLQPEQNAGTFLDDGWLLTGDLGRLDEAGRLYLTGRAKDVIIRGSHNIDPQAIEDALLAHPDVSVAAAVGMPDSYAGELPVAFVSLGEDADVSASEILEFLGERINEPAAMPKKLEIVDSIPLTPIGKIYKPLLRKQAIGWAIADAAGKAGIDATEYAVEVDDSLAVCVQVVSSRLEDLRQCLVGMPISVCVQARDAVG